MMKQDNVPIQKSNALFNNLIQSAVDGVIAADKTGKILVFNKVASDICGYSVEEALDNLDIRDIYPADGAKEVMRMLRSEDYGGRGKLSSYAVELRHKNGKNVPVNLYAAIVYEGDEEAASVGFFHDMRETLRMKQELEETQLQLLQAEKMSSLGRLAAGVAHQLNNPLAGVVIYAGLLLEEYDLPAKAKQDLNRVLSDAQRCHNIVKELLEFARPASQEKAPHDLNQALSRTLFLLENQPLFQNVKVNKVLSPSLPMVPGIRQQLNHLFMNLLINAVDAMEGSGELTIKTTFVKERDVVRIEISDTGPGIPPDVIPHIFEPFFTTKAEGKGTGLGLSLVFNIVRDHSGKICVESSPGKGARFILEFPVEREDVQNGRDKYGDK